MELTNYRDLSQSGSSTGVGFQFEFYCGCCTHTWKSPFEPYRRGQLAGFIYKLSRFIGDRGSLYRATNTVADIGAKGARESAFKRAQELAESRYAVCPGCEKIVCSDCWDARAGKCESCTVSAGGPSRSSGQGNNTAVGSNCPNCKTPMNGGRFCAECGFDMASTHKSCPGCGTLCIRAARFCTDCGHGF